MGMIMVKKTLGANHIKLEEECHYEKVVSSPIHILQLCIYIIYLKLHLPLQLSITETLSRM